MELTSLLGIAGAVLIAFGFAISQTAEVRRPFVLQGSIGFLASRGAMILGVLMIYWGWG